MKVGIIGAGAIGMLMGSYLAEAGLNVTMLTRSHAQCQSLLEKGICRIDERGRKTIQSIHATTHYQALQSMNLLIIAVKYKDISAVLQNIKAEKMDIPLLFIQNGLAHLEDLKENEFSHMAFATVEHGAMKKNDYTVMHNGVGRIVIGERFGHPHHFDLLESANGPAFPVIRHHDAAYILLRKALINCLINPLTTILKVPNGQLIESEHALELLTDLYDELLDAFPEMAQDLPFSAVVEICERTARNHSSMLADYEAGRPMEIQTIVSAVIQKAKWNGKNLPLLATYEKILLVLDRKA